MVIKDANFYDDFLNNKNVIFLINQNVIFAENKYFVIEFTII